MTDARAVIAGGARWSCVQAEALAWLRSLPDRCVSLVLFSPPYEKARRYGEVNFKLKGQAWVDWLRPIVVESARVSSGLVLVNAAGQVAKHKYSPVVEWLVSDLTRLDGLVCGPSPYAWIRNGVPGSGSKHSGYHKRCWEPIYSFAMKDRLPLKWHDHLAFGKPPKFPKLGGMMSNRNEEGRRANAAGLVKRNRFGVSATSTRRRQGNDEREQVKWTAPTSGGNGDMGTRTTSPPAIANPGNIIRTGNGGNQLGHPLAHKNEAPMNLAVAERCVCWFAPPDSIVLDPFTGSGTTTQAAVEHGRRFIGCDLRQSQVDICFERMGSVTASLFAAPVINTGAERPAPRKILEVATSGGLFGSDCDGVS